MKLRRSIFLLSYLALNLSFPARILFAQESLTLTTYYPSPFGVYDRLRLAPRNTVPACTGPNEWGTMYYDDTLPGLQICENDGSGGGTWTALSSGSSGPTNIWDRSAPNVFLQNPNDLVGIGTSTPDFKLTLDNDGGIIARGVFGSGAVLPPQGVGSRLIWYPRKAAIRVGYISGGGMWDDINIGNGSTVSGGYDNSAVGQYATASGGFFNNAYGPNSVISGGFNNGIAPAGDRGTVSGGAQNVVWNIGGTIGGGVANTTSFGQYSTVAGGTDNWAAGDYSAVSGGQSNRANQTYSTVSGGSGNQATGQAATVSGGQSNSATNIGSTVGGGQLNQATGTHSFVGAGQGNQATGPFSVVVGGGGLGPPDIHNTASGDHSVIVGGGLNTAAGPYSAVVGGGGSGLANSISAISRNSFIGGGGLNTINNSANGYATISGGNQNLITSGGWETIGGGLLNQITGSGSDGTIGGGVVNRVTGFAGTVAGGGANIAGAGFEPFVGGGVINTASGDYSGVLGGFSNQAIAPYSISLGGFNNDVLVATANYAVISGGFSNRTSAANSWVGGQNQTLTNAATNTFVWGRIATNVTAPNAFMVFPDASNINGANGRLGIGVSDPQYALHVDGNALVRDLPAIGGTTNVMATAAGQLVRPVSSRKYKKDIRNLSLNTEKVLQLQPVKFIYTTTGEKDIGLIAEDVDTLLPDLVVEDEKGEPQSVKYDKLSLYLLGVVKTLKTENEGLRDNNASLNRRLDALEKRMKAVK